MAADASEAAIQARKFEDEKRRIVDSCFAKKDDDGSQIESYITHLRVAEDSAYPSTPAPPQSPPENKKPRVVIVAVRKSGRVRVHKARENSNGTFSIGKTWNLDDLGPIRSFTDPIAAPGQDGQFQQWAGDTGFIVSLGKQYYWQAATYKEKDFFINSLVKIYRKYTGGKSPELLGFSPQEEQRLLAATPRATPTPPVRSPVPRTPNNFPPRAPSAGSAMGRQPNPPPSAGSDYSRPPNRSEAVSPAAPEERRIPSQDGLRAPSRDGVRVPSRDANRAPSRNGLFAPPPPDQNMRAPSREGFRPPPPPNANMRAASREGFRAPSREGFRDMRRQPSKEQMLRQPSQDQTPRMPGAFASPPTSRAEATPPPPPAHVLQPNPQPSLSAASYATNKPASNGTAAPVPENDEALRALAGEISNGVKSQERSPERKRKSLEVRGISPGPKPSPERLPERRRPPVQGAESYGQKSVKSDTNSQFSTPLATPVNRNVEEPVVPQGPQTPEAPIETKPEITQSPGYFAQAKMEDTRDKDVSETASVKSGKSLKQNVTEEKSTLVPTPVDGQVTPTPPPVPESESVDNGEHRPGLGPMIKKKSTKDIAGQFRKAALAAAAFKPRAGGAGERLMTKKDAPSNEPDGITSVVPAPLLRGMSGDSARSGTPEPKDFVKSPLAEAPPALFSSKPSSEAPKIQLQRKATEDRISEKPAPVKREELQEARPSSPDKARSRSPGRRRRQMQEARVAKYCNALSVDPKVLEGRGGDFDDLLTEMGWDGRLEENKTVDDLQADIRREIGRAQATGWLGHIEQQETKTQQLASLFEKVIEECEELDGLLTLYQHELGTLDEDVSFIEAQGQGLQVQTANQKLLQTELENLLRTISISSEDLRDLREASLGNPEGLDAAEQALSMLYKAMLTIDPDIRQNRKRQADNGPNDRGGIGVYADTELGQMRAVKEKKDDYRDETQLFLKRLNQYMNMAFKMAEQRTSDYLQQNKSGLPSHATKLDPRLRDPSRNELWMYNALMLFVREVNSYEWQTLISTYESSTKSAFQDQFRDNVFAFKKITRKPTGDEQDLLFTSQEKDKESDVLGTAARKLTVKRGKTVRVGGGVRQSTGERQDGRIEPYEAFAGVVEEQTRSIAEEQNFVVEFFHLDSLSTTDFADVVASTTPRSRRLPNLTSKHSYDPDRDMAKTVEKVMDNLYSFWPQDLQNLVAWTTQTDQLQGVGLLYVIEKKMSDFEETNQEYITKTFQRVHEGLMVRFHKFVDDQIRGIEETKVKIKKRKGIISFMRVFPSFSSVIEGMIPSPTSNSGHHESLEIRFTINEAYGKINKAMFDTLNFIAKENPGVTAPGPATTSTVSGDPEDKEALNYHILMIENMNHYLEEVETRNNVVLEEWQEKASHEFYDHMKQYTDAVIRRPLGKLLDFIESTESLIKSSSDGNYASIASRPSHSRSTAKKIAAQYDAKEIRKGVETLKKRIEKHFGSEDSDPSLNVGKSLIVKVFGECSARYADAHDRMRGIVEKVYEGQGQGMEFDWRKEEVSSMFRR